MGKFHKVGNAMHFFIMGVPGGIFYFMETLRVMGKMDAMDVKRINHKLNMWMRMPFITMCCVLAHVQTATMELSPLYLAIRYFMILLFAWNGIYFADLAAISYGKRLGFDKAAAKQKAK